MDTRRERKKAADARGGRIRLQVAKWGNSLALRLPAESARALGVGEGDVLAGEISPDGRLILSAPSRVLGKADVSRMRKFLSGQKKTTPAVEALRASSRY